MKHLITVFCRLNTLVTAVELSMFTRLSLVFFFNDTATTEIYTLSLHDALPIYVEATTQACAREAKLGVHTRASLLEDRKSTRLNSSHSQISYAVFCLKKKKKMIKLDTRICSFYTFVAPIDLVLFNLIESGSTLP